ncbi:AMP-binding protein [Nocardia pneumoniae]|uniref:AMP-binding protein n=1 Tax=Nocardia pneumoniae TaxID=228601 RepID=UPI0002E2095B|nr:class I adenylate-forming enzyme family protein [Nocardia pneumoniae]
MWHETEPADIGLTEFVVGDLDDELGGESARRRALVDYTSGTGRRWSYGELVEAIDQVAAGLRASGVGEDDVVAVILDNSAQFVAAFHGVLAIGAVVLPLDPRAPMTEWNTRPPLREVRAVLTSWDIWDRLDAAGIGRELRCVQAVHVGDTPLNTSGCLVWWHGSLDESASGAMPNHRGGNRTAVLAEPGGTQGAWERAELTHSGLIADLRQTTAALRPRESDVVLAATPLQRIGNMQIAVNLALRARATVVLPRNPCTPADLVQLLKHHRVTVAHCTPDTLAELATSGLDAQRFPKLRLVVSSDGPLDTTISEECAHRLGVPVEIR